VVMLVHSVPMESQTFLRRGSITGLLP